MEPIFCSPKSVYQEERKPLKRKGNVCLLGLAISESVPPGNIMRNKHIKVFLTLNFELKSKSVHVGKESSNSDIIGENKA